MLPETAHSHREQKATNTKCVSERKISLAAKEPFFPKRTIVSGSVKDAVHRHAFRNPHHSAVKDMRSSGESRLGFLKKRLKTMNTGCTFLNSLSKTCARLWNVLLQCNKVDMLLQPHTATTVQANACEIVASTVGMPGGDGMLPHSYIE